MHWNDIVVVGGGGCDCFGTDCVNDAIYVQCDAAAAAAADDEDDDDNGDDDNECILMNIHT